MFETLSAHELIENQRRRMAPPKVVEKRVPFGKFFSGHPEQYLGRAGVQLHADTTHRV